MGFLSKDTIVALATAPLAAGVAVIRLSGPQALQSAVTLAPTFDGVVPRKMHYAKLLGRDAEILDNALLVFFKGNSSFTGEDVVEIHCHGGRAVVQSILDTLQNLLSVRHAEAGEFSRRAFLNGKMDLTEAEGLSDLISAETEEQRKQAVRQMDGALGQFFEDSRQDIMHLLAHVEAAVDFPDEELEVLEQAGLQEKLQNLISHMQASVSVNVGQRVRDGFQTVIIGKPNAGKSTLTNLLTGRETAIVSPIEGTTRDVVEAHLNIGGYPIILADTAGLRDSDDVIEQKGIEKAKKKVEEADLRMLVIDANNWPNIPDEHKAMLAHEGSVIVVSKIDENNINNTVKYIDINGFETPVVYVDLTQDESLKTVLSVLELQIRKQFEKSQSAALITRERHRSAVRDALVHLQRALTLFEQKSEMSLSDLLAQDLRDAARSIGTITGRTDSEDVLDLVFSTFCIGK